MKVYFRCADDEDETKEAYEWYTGTVNEVCNGSNFLNETGSYHRKVNAFETQWHADSDKGEQINFSIVNLKKTLFNSYVEYGWGLCFDSSWSNIPFQTVCQDEDNGNGKEIGPDNKG